MKRKPQAAPQDSTTAQPISLDVLREKYLKAGETDAEQLYARAAQCTPADAMERLDVEAARAEVGG